MLRVELGGGDRPRAGYLNLDAATGQGPYRLDLAAPGLRLPFADATVDRVYSSHCLEHVDPYQCLLREVCRVCRPGALFELRVPHWLQSMALCPGHRHTVSPTQVRHWVKDFPATWFGDCPRRLALLGTVFVPGEAFGAWRKLLPQATRGQVLRLCPDACHEVRYYFRVVPHDG